MLTVTRRRLKDNFSVIKEEHRPLLLAAKIEVEKEMAEKKWMLIAHRVKQSGGDSYTVSRPNLPRYNAFWLTIPGR